MKIRNHATEARVAGKIVEAPTTPKRAIRMKCLDCSAGQIVEVRECSHTRCPLWPFRMGKNPYHGRAKGEVKVGELAPEIKVVEAIKCEDGKHTADCPFCSVAGSFTVKGAAVERSKTMPFCAHESGIDPKNFTVSFTKPDEAEGEAEGEADGGGDDW